jgi:hypothetical protein
MAKRAGVNKSQKIRDALAANPRKSPSEISVILKAEGLVVKPQYVSTIKANWKTASRRSRGLTMRGTARRTQKSAGRSSFAAIHAGLEFVKAAGGIESAKSVLATIEEISSVAR